MNVPALVLQPDPVEAVRAISVGALLLVIPLYFLPTILGWQEKKRGAIFAVNFLLGWTVIGWIVAFVWAAAPDTTPSRNHSAAGA